jgi:hypothetical protein
MNLQSIAERTGLPLRTLRYVVDHKLVPNLRVRVSEHEVGRPRLFADDVGVAIACAALLLEAGLKRDAVERIIHALAELNFRPENPRKGLTIADIIRNRTPAVILIGDGKNCRGLIESESLDSGWLQVRPLARLAKDYAPMVVVQFDLGRLVRQLLD